MLRTGSCASGGRPCSSRRSTPVPDRREAVRWYRLTSANRIAISSSGSCGNAPRPAGDPLADLECSPISISSRISTCPRSRRSSACSSLPEARALGCAPRRALALKQAAILRPQGRFAEAAGRGIAAPAPADARLPRARGSQPRDSRARCSCCTSPATTRRSTSRAAQSRSPRRAATAPLLARAARPASLVAYRAGRHAARPRDRYEEALTLFRRLGDEAQVAWVRNNLGLVRKNLLRVGRRAVAHFDEAIAIHRRLGQYAQLAVRAAEPGRAASRRAARGTARTPRSTRRAQRFTPGRQPLGIAAINLGLGTLARLERRLDDAEARLHEALERAPRRGVRARGGAGARVPRRPGVRPRRRRARRSRPTAPRSRSANARRPAGDVVSEVLRRIAEVADRARPARRRRRRDRARDPRLRPARRPLRDTRSLQRVRGRARRRAAADVEARAAVPAPAPVEPARRDGRAVRARQARCSLLARVTSPIPPRRASSLYRASACFAEVGAERELAREKLAEAGSPARPTRPGALGVAPPRRPRRPAARPAARKLARRASSACSRAHGARARPRRPRRRHRPVRHRARRDRHRQGAGRPRHPRAERAAPTGRSSPSTAARCAPSSRFAALRPPARRLHRRARRRRRPRRGGPHGHAVPRRDRRAAARRPGRRSCASSSRASTCASARRRCAAPTFASSAPPTSSCVRAVAERRFRADLFYRLHEIEIQLPAAARAPRGRRCRWRGTSCAPTADSPRARARARARRTCCVALRLAGQRARARELHEARARARRRRRRDARPRPRSIRALAVRSAPLDSAGDRSRAPSWRGRAARDPGASSTRRRATRAAPPSASASRGKTLYARMRRLGSRSSNPDRYPLDGGVTAGGHHTISEHLIAQQFAVHPGGGLSFRRETPSAVPAGSPFDAETATHYRHNSSFRNG